MNYKIVLVSCLTTVLLSACMQDSATLPPPVENEAQAVTSGLSREIKSAHEESHVIGRLQAGKAEADRAFPSSKKINVMPAMEMTAQASLASLRAADATVLRDKYATIAANPVKKVSEDPVSTFSIDVDTGSYAVVRRYLNNGSLPPTDAVRIEELINYFDYQYPNPQDKNAPFTLSTEVAVSPWNAQRHLLQIGLQGYLPEQQRPDANLVFLIDVSGSMNASDKLPLLKNAFRLLVKQLSAQDRVTMVVYAGSSGVVLEPTAGDRQADILAALDRLSAGGSTHGSSGIQLAYAMAQQSFIKQGINRVILATDGDFNVGTVNHQALIDLIERQRDQGIALTTLGFGSGNYNDHLMEQLADHGDGNYAYIDSLNEAKKVLVEQLNSTLQTIARDVKIQIAWNPQQVAEYRLIGYENRLLNREDFNNDKVEAGDIGAGHRVTALYEITLADSDSFQIEPLRYQDTQSAGQPSISNEMAFVRLRYKEPDADTSKLIEQPLLRSELKSSINRASHSLQFAAAVAAWGELLRGGEKLQNFEYADVLKLARQSKGDDIQGYRSEFLKLVELSELLDS